jgi:hypothetical protein
MTNGVARSRQRDEDSFPVMAGLVLAIDDFLTIGTKNVDARDI